MREFESRRGHVSRVHDFESGQEHVVSYQKYVDTVDTGTNPVFHWWSGPFFIQVHIEVKKFFALFSEIGLLILE